MLISGAITTQSDMCTYREQEKKSTGKQQRLKIQVRGLVLVDGLFAVSFAAL